MKILKEGQRISFMKSVGVREEHEDGTIDRYNTLKRAMGYFQRWCVLSDKIEAIVIEDNGVVHHVSLSGVCITNKEIEDES